MGEFVVVLLVYIFQESLRQCRRQLAQAPSRQTGYDCKLIKRPKKAPFQIHCPICLQILQEPYQSSCCHKNFCRNCIDAVKETKRSCPLCQKTFYDLRPNKEVEILLKDLQVRCSHCTNGCKWTGKLAHHEQHLNLNPSPESRVEGCAFVELQCFYGCGDELQRHLLDEHEKEDCCMRPYSCGHCHEYSSVFLDVVYIHWRECRLFPVSCHQNCGLKSIERQNLKHHIDNECPLTVIKCDFHYAGCEELLPRKVMAAHLTAAHEGQTPVTQVSSKQVIIIVCLHSYLLTYLLLSRKRENYSQFPHL